MALRLGDSGFKVRSSGLEFEFRAEKAQGLGSGCRCWEVPVAPAQIWLDARPMGPRRNGVSNIHRKII